MSIIYTSQRIRRRKQSRRAREMQAANNRLVEKLTQGIKRKQISFAIEEDNWPTLPLSNKITGSVFPKRDILNDYKWKHGCEETAETIESFKEKIGRVTPLYNKGGYQLATLSDDPTKGRRR